ncbi:MAG: NAD(P)-dependent oxidoreductase [Peptococcaceae bacterium]|nr:NAD(P)-dependent oxidoreductase [Peptococcaceae bacterium]
MKPSLDMMLFGLTLLLKRNAKKPAVRALLHNRTHTVEIRTADKTTSRYFVFCGKDLFSRRGQLANPDVALVWKTPSVAVDVLSSSDPDAFQSALARGDVSIAGNGDVAAWFGNLTNVIRGRTPSDAGADKPPVAVIGLGRMGSGIAHSLLRNGFPVTVYNRTESKTRPLVEAGAKAASTPAQAAKSAKYVITSLMDDTSVLAVLEGPDGLLAGLEPGAVHIGASTVSPEMTRHLVKAHTEHGSDYLAAPVVGRPDAANAGELMTLVCGQQTVCEASRPVLDGYTKLIQYLGENHQIASAAKLAVNYAAITIIDLMGQIYTFGEKTGIPLEALHMSFRMMWAQPVLQEYASRIWHRDFDDVGFDMQSGLKDVTLMVNTSESNGVRWGFAETIQHKMKRGLETGLAQKDWGSVYEVTRAEAGL